MAVGTVVRFDGMRGYGFIAPDGGGEDVFVHLRDITEGPNIQSGARVEFEVVQGDRGLKASDVRVVTGGRLPDHEPRPVERTRAADDDTCDVLSAADFGTAVTDLLINAAPTITAAELAQIRHALRDFARAHGWLD